MQQLSKNHEIKFYHNINNTCLISAGVKAWDELLRAGLLTNSAIPIHWSYKGIGLFIDGKLAGFITYDMVYDNTECQIILGYVNPEYRGQGWYKVLNDALEDSLDKSKVRRITGTTSTQNLPMIRYNERNRHPAYVTYEKILKED